MSYECLINLIVIQPSNASKQIVGDSLYFRLVFCLQRSLWNEKQFVNNVNQLYKNQLLHVHCLEWNWVSCNQKTLVTSPHYYRIWWHFCETCEAVSVSIGIDSRYGRVGRWETERERESFGVSVRTRTKSEAVNLFRIYLGLYVGSYVGRAQSIISMIETSVS